ncbi:hypothetical protein VM1G_05467 [Cytospora mali]|uniref:Uncharacterized protein n=1 Tax=Cytospora mali TaxID=578113 RepID=A0A194W169_CYTMA|nr:hypothetical protein VM1G_05467 [Valsa mali]
MINKTVWGWLWYRSPTQLPDNLLDGTSVKAEGGTENGHPAAFGATPVLAPSNNPTSSVEMALSFQDGGMELTWSFKLCMLWLGRLASMLARSPSPSVELTTFFPNLEVFIMLHEAERSDPAEIP